MYHIANDSRARKSAELILQGLYKALETKPFKEIKVTDIYLNSYVSRATFYRLFDSVHDVLLYQCDQIVDEISASMSSIHFENEKEMGLYHVKLWLAHESLIKVIVENRLTDLMYESVMSHKEGLKAIYGLDYEDNPYTKYLVYFIVSIVFTSFAIFLEEKGKRSIEEVLEITNGIVAKIVDVWGIRE